MKNLSALLRPIMFAEAISYLVLLTVAMPLKYIWHMAAAVKIAGSIHGALFVVFCIALQQACLAGRWPTSRAALLFIASFVPVLPFFLDQRLREWTNTETSA
jgi:integral membrane protein